ncbi:4-alpha-glucanotransferase [Undibacterium sp.]|uniref:4-alpha-glucanotransferase n=1 Tax=Undibacterium sp. TaxID=1914977 RepID=UPI00374DDF71
MPDKDADKASLTSLVPLDALIALAEAAGLATHWIDAHGQHQSVSAGSLQAILTALQLPCNTQAECDASHRKLLLQDSSTALPPLLTGDVDVALALPAHSCLQGRQYRIALEQGGLMEGRFADGENDPVLPPISTAGYHKLETDGHAITLAIAPPRCFGIEDALCAQHARSAQQPLRLWGLSAQLYSLRHAGDGGIGNFSSLRILAESAARHGAAMLAISPVHAMFSAEPHSYSPYSPSSRLFLNILHIDAAALFGEEILKQAVAELGQQQQQRWHELEEMPLIDWPQASELKLQVLRLLYSRFTSNAAELKDKRVEFEEFCRQGGEALESHARFEALHAWMKSTGVQGGWQAWPAAYHQPDSDAVLQFAREHHEEVCFHLFLQWLASTGLQTAQQAAAGMCVGLVADLAVGADNGGSQAWSRQEEILSGLSVGAPPDLFNPDGQSWGLGAFSPHAMRDKGYRAYLEMLRAVFAHAGGIRIDHVLGLGRLWLVPDGTPASQGAYLHYPMEDLLRLIALESWRHRAVVIGEDLGTVPDGFRERLLEKNLMGIQVLWFQRDGGGFFAPADWRRGATGTTGTHDLPTVAGWWSGHDIVWRAQLGTLEHGEAKDEAMAGRARERHELWQAMSAAGCARGEAPLPQADAAPLAEIIRFLNATPAEIAVVPLEDALGLAEQPNIPGSGDVHPNWRRRLAADVLGLLDVPAVAARLQLLDGQRSNRREKS